MVDPLDDTPRVMPLREVHARFAAQLLKFLRVVAHNHTQGVAGQHLFVIA
jgi:hypothetical protein